MMKHLLELNSGRRGRVLMLLGLALLIFSLCKLYSMDSFAQQIAPAAPETAASADPGADAGDEDAADPADTTANTDPLTAQIKAWNEKRTEMGGTRSHGHGRGGLRYLRYHRLGAEPDEHPGVRRGGVAGCASPFPHRRLAVYPDGL